MEDQIQRVIKRRELDQQRKQDIQEKACNIIKMYDCDWWISTKQIILVNSNYAKLSPTKFLSEKRNFKRISKLEVYLVMFNVILKYPRLSEKLLPFFHPSSRTLLLLEMTLVPLWKNMPRKKHFCPNLAEC